MKHFGILLVVLLSSYLTIFSQTWPADTIHAQINVGNPSFPFPQFLEYTSGKTLAANNAEGVTHADMEKSMREGYQIMMHRCLYVPGKVLNGKKYISYNNNSVPSNYGTFVSEGDGYAMLAAAYFADKEAFDGLWLWIHDNRLSKVKKYLDCSDLRPNYPHGAYMACWQCDETADAGQTSVNSATDGDYDIAMGLLIAAAQWPGGMGINDACGNPISYRDEALKVMKALVDTVNYTKAASGAAAGTKGYLTGDIGIDGYCKNGNTWAEITNWRYSAANTAFAWANAKPDPLQVKDLYTDYIGPAYFHEFSKYLTYNGGTPWQINQFKRGEASSDWLIGQLYAKGYIASSGSCSVSDDGAITTFGQHPSGPGGEDFRASWRTILNYVWHGNPETKWNPVTHQVDAGGNTFEMDMGLRHADFLKFPRTLPSANTAANCEKMGASPDPSSPTWKGVANIKQAHLVTGAEGSDNYRTNYNVGTGAAAAVASGDLELIGEIYRQSEILWDDVNTALPKTAPDEERYIRSTPKYFHDWFRLLGMATTSGNLHPYGNMVPAANMKVYLSVDKTYAYAGDLVTYTVDYRNYGSVDATGVNISSSVGQNYEFVSASNGGAFAGGGIKWSIGTVPGFKTATGIPPTKGSVTFTVKVKSITIQTTACLTSAVTSANAPTWNSNEYPNNASYTMERNCVDLLPARSLNITKTADRTIMNPGDIVNFKLDFENKSAPDLWLNGGRDNIVISYGNYYLPSNTFYQFYRFWHSAPEAYVNMGNYRVSYFMNDPAAVGLYNAASNPTGWAFSVDNQNDLDKYFYNPSILPADQRITFTHQEIPWGSNAGGSWNQRIMIRFANVLTAPTTHIYDKLDNMYLIHKGVIGPGFIRTKMESTPPSSLAARLSDDWSYSNTVDIGKVDGQDKRLSPITNSWANPTNPDLPVTNYSKDVCDPPVVNYNKLLVEEFDGYTWRRIAGNGPLPGRETYNVEVIDTIPKELAWDSFTDAEALGITATYTPAAAGAAYSGIVKWLIPVMQVGAQGDLGYRTIAKDLTPACPTADRNFINIGYIRSQTDSPDTSGVKLKISCNPVPPTKPVETSLHKTADKTHAEVGDVLTYTLEFKNTDGSTASWVSGAAADWQVLGSGNTMPDMNKPSIDLDQNGNTSKPGANGYAFGHKKSHGVNGYIEASFDLSNSSPFSFIFRHSGGTPGKADFLGVALKITPNPGGPNTINFEVSNNGTVLSTLTGISYGGSSDPVSIRAELTDDQLYIWVNKFTGAPLKVIGGITQMTAGYAGLFTAGAQQKVTAWKTHFDSSFDLLISDPVPVQLGNVTAISNSGTLSAGSISWPAVAGPIAYGSSIVRTFQATVNTCNDFITNIAHASVYGIPDIASQFVVTCGTAVCTAPVVTSAATGNICNNTPQNYVIKADISSATFTWSRAAVSGISNASVSGMSTSTIIESLNNTGPSAIVVRYVISPADGACTGTPFNYDVTVNPRVNINSASTGNVCSGKPLSYAIRSTSLTATYTWSRAQVAGISNAAAVDQTTNPIAETLVNTGVTPVIVHYLISPAGSKLCPVTPFNYDLTVNPSPSITSSVSGSICSGAPQNYDITSTFTDVTYSWSRASVAGISNPPANGQTADPITEVLTNTGTDPIVARYVISPIAGTCRGEDFNYDVTVSSSLFFTSSPTADACSGSPTNYDIVSNINSTTFKWNRAAVPGISNVAVSAQADDPIKEVLINSTSAPVVVRYVIAATATGCAAISDFNLDVTVNPSPQLTSVTSASICSGLAENYKMTSDMANATFVWSRSDVAGVSNAAVTGKTDNPITETLLNATANPVVVKYIITPLASGCEGAPSDYLVTVKPASLVTSAASGSICTSAAQNYDITSNLSNTTFTWSRAAVAGISNIAVNNQSADPISEVLTNTGATPTIVRYVITPSGSGCPGIPFNYDVTVNPVPAISSASSGIICSGLPQNYNIISIVNAATFTWSRAAVSDISNPPVTDQHANPVSEILVNSGTSANVVRYVIIPSLGSCEGKPFNYDVTVNPGIQITEQPQGTNLCGGAPLNLNIQASGKGLTYQWKINGTDISGAISDSYVLPVTNTSNTGQYTVLINGTCGPVISDMAEVVVSKAPSTTSEVLGSVACLGNDGTISIVNAQEGITYQAFSGSTSAGPASAGDGSNLILTVPTSTLVEGKNIISIHASGCNDVVLNSTATIQVVPLPLANAGADTLLDDFKEVKLDGSLSSQGPYTYLWTSPDPSALIESPSGISTVVLPKEATTDFILTVSNLINTSCKSSDVVTVKVTLHPLVVPNAFSPNGDGIHDQFEIPGIKSYPQAMLYVYNQWGELIYESAPGYTVLWDGTRNGKPVQVSAYYYILVLNDGSKIEQSGSITIIK